MRREILRNLDERKGEYIYIYVYIMCWRVITRVVALAALS